MSTSALGAARHAGTGGERPLAWPRDHDPLRFADGPVCGALIRTAMGCRYGLGVEPLVALRGDGCSDCERPEALSALTLDVLLVVLDLLHRGGGAAPVNARAILARKGYRRWGRERQVFERKILDQLQLLHRFAVVRGHGAEPLFSFAPRNVARTDFIVRAAPVLAAELDTASWIEIDNAVLRLDHRQNRGADVLAKKLAIAVAQVGSAGVFRVADLLMLAGRFPGERCSARGDRLAEQISSALRRLRTLGVFDIEGLEALESRRRARRNWLAIEVTIRPRSADRPPAATVASTFLRVASPSSGDKGEPAPVPPCQVRPRGRPRFEPKPEQRLLVRALCARGATREQIANAIGVSLPTLRRAFAMDFECAGGEAA